MGLPQPKLSHWNAKLLHVSTFTKPGEDISLSVPADLPHIPLRASFAHQGTEHCTLYVNSVV